MPYSVHPLNLFILCVCLTVGATTRGTGGPISTPFSPPSVPAPGMPQQPTLGGISAGMPSPPTVSKFSRKAYGGGRLGEFFSVTANCFYTLRLKL